MTRISPRSFRPALVRSGIGLAAALPLAMAVPASAGFLDNLLGPSGPPQTSAPAPAAPVTPAPSPAAAQPPAAPAAPAPKLVRRAAVPLPVPRPAGLAAAEPAAAAAAEPALAPPSSGGAAAIPVRADAAAPLALQAASAKARPAAVARDGFSAAQVGTVQRIDDWFNSFDHLVGTFTQIAPDGARSRGRFFLEKPGKLRFQYALPSTLDIVSNGKTIAVVDHKLDTSDVYPLSQTPLRFLLKRNLDLLDDAKVTAVKNTSGRASVTVEEASRVVGTSRLTVVFGGNPFALKQWTVTDPQGLDTTVMVDHLDSQQIPPAQAFTIN